MLLLDITGQWLERHVAQLESGERYADSVLVWGRFWDHLRSQRLLPDPLTVASINNALIDLFVDWRRKEGASAPTISRDIAAVRGPINWAVNEQILASAPRVKDVKGKKKSRELTYDFLQMAAMLEIAHEQDCWRHVFMFMLIHLSTHGRTFAITELEDAQIRHGMIYFNAEGREQTRKRRSIVPICPTLAPWLAGVRGRLVKYRVPVSEKKQAAGAPPYLERTAKDIGGAFDSVLIAAHERTPALKLARQARDENDNPIWLPPRAKLGETKRRPMMEGIGTPNTLRHTIHTWHQRQGVPQAQIDLAAGHRTETGSGSNYTHMRPEYLREFIESTEAFWNEMSKHTQVHLRSHYDPKVTNIGVKRIARGGKSA